MTDSYLTIDRRVGGTVEALVEVKRSKFLGQVARVEDEVAARAFIADVRARHHDARHHCTAFVIGPEGALRRSNDDGEPSGTAGRPMLEALSGRGVSDVVAVVTRWFGGTLLGAGGLVRAYSDAVVAALDAAGTRTRSRRSTATVTASVAEAGSLDHRLRGLGEVLDVQYGREEVEFRVAVTDLAVLEPFGPVVGESVWADLP